MNKKYFKVQLKRAFKIYPTILLVTLMTVISIAITCVVVLQTNASDKQQQKITIGVVGNVENSYLDIGLTALKNMDDSTFCVDWLELTEDEAKKALKSRKIDGYIHVPENYVENIIQGENTPAKYVMINAPEGFGTIISAEIAETISCIVTESQAGMYSMHNFAWDYNRKNFTKNNNALAMEYVDFIINRGNLYNIVTLGVADSLSFIGYYICSLLLLFVLLWGMSCNKIFTSKNNEYSRLLNISGITPRYQIFCEYGAYLAITLSTLFLFAVGFGLVMQFVDFNIPELIGVRIIDCIFFVVKILPVILMITLMQNAVYELISNTVAALLTQFILTVFLGYISGCFYPYYFFPETLQNISSLLPIGTGFAYIRKALTGFPDFKDIILVFGYGYLFFCLTCWVRKYRVIGDIR